ncbi:MAG: DUF4160 domain-containing protein [Deltaproteobacteria bacterium]|nr:DUF4160 domain-containing protein [Deltaproteobacteria bacterium]
MPTISRFYGITIMMYHDEHGRPHFHAAYGGRKFKISIWPLGFEGAEASPRVRSLVLEWAALHQAELLANWDRMRRGEKPEPIAPLD